MTERSDSELLAIVSDGQQDYEPEALEAAKQELVSRNLDTATIEEAKQENETKKQIVEEKATAKLGFLSKIFAFLIPGLVLFVYSGRLKGDGYDRKAKELTNWTLYGFGFYFGLVILIFILN